MLGILVGSALQIALQAPGLRGFRYSLALDLRHPGVRRIARLYLPVAAGLVVSQVGVLIDRNLASQTGEGSMAAMRFATTLVQFPLGLVGSAVALCRAAHPVAPRRRRPGRTATPAPTRPPWPRGLRMVLMLIVPAAVGLAVLREPLVRLLFQRGAFDAGATARTALAFLCYSPSIPFAAIDQVLIFAFYARKNTVTPVLVGVLGVGVYLAVALPLMPSLGMAGLVIANSVQWVAHALVLLALLWRAVGGLARPWAWAPRRRKVAAASALMGAAVLLAGPLAEGILPGSGAADLAVRLTGLVVLGVGVYVLAALALRLGEISWLWGLARERLGR